MKNIKYVFLGIFISILVFVIAIVLNAFFSSNSKVYIKEYEPLKKNMAELNKKLDSVKDKDCKSALEDMKNRILDTNVTKDTTLKKYYDGYFKELIFSDYYLNVVDVCKLENTDLIYYEVLASQTFPFEIKARYNSRYEFKIKDYLFGEDIRKESDELGSYNTKVMELKVYSELLKEVVK